MIKLLIYIEVDSYIVSPWYLIQVQVGECFMHLHMRILGRLSYLTLCALHGSQSGHALVNELRV